MMKSPAALLLVQTVLGIDSHQEGSNAPMRSLFPSSVVPFQAYVWAVPQQGPPAGSKC